MPASKNSLYTFLKLRDQIKKKILQGAKGGTPNQWSARKAQLLNHEYQKRVKARGRNPFLNSSKILTKSQKGIRKWTAQKWETSNGKAHATTKSGLKRRYLPHKTWKTMSSQAKKETNRKKLRGGKIGRQYVAR